MQIQGIYAALATASMANAEQFYTQLFEREPDDRPMDGLIQWRDVAGANKHGIGHPYDSAAATRQRSSGAA